MLKATCPNGADRRRFLEAALVREVLYAERLEVEAEDS